jgi:hypothetical protein
MGAPRLVSADSDSGQLPAVVIAWLQANLATGSTIVYSNGAYPNRPSGAPAGAITYVGPVQPTTWLAGDAWRDIS